MIASPRARPRPSLWIVYRVKSSASGTKKRPSATASKPPSNTLKSCSCFASKRCNICFAWTWRVRAKYDTGCPYESWWLARKCSNSRSEMLSSSIACSCARSRSLNATLSRRGLHNETATFTCSSLGKMPRAASSSSRSDVVHSGTCNSRQCETKDGLTIPSK